MTAKEKAIELFSYYGLIIENKTQAKISTLYCVNQIISICDTVYWQDVKNELKKL